MKILYTVLKEHMINLSPFIEQSYRFSFSAGIVMYPLDDSTWNDLINHASIALKKAKEGYCIDCNDEAIALFEVSSKEDLLYHLDHFLPLYQLDGMRSDEKLNSLIEGVKLSGKQSFEWLYINSNMNIYLVN